MHIRELNVYDCVSIGMFEQLDLQGHVFCQYKWIMRSMEVTVFLKTDILTPMSDFLQYNCPDKMSHFKGV